MTRDYIDELLGLDKALLLTFFSDHTLFFSLNYSCAEVNMYTFREYWTLLSYTDLLPHIRILYIMEKGPCIFFDRL